MYISTESILVKVYKGWIASILEEEEGWASKPVKVQAYGLADPLPSIGGVAADPNRRNYQEERFFIRYETRGW